MKLKSSEKNANPKMPRVSAIIVTFNSENVILNCLQTLGSHDWLEIIVIDNNSKDGTVTKISETFPNARLILNQENIGFAAAVNMAAKSAAGNILLLLNPDAEIDSENLARAAEALDSDKSIGILSPFTSEGDGSFKTLAAGRFPTLPAMFNHATGLSRLSSQRQMFMGHYLLKAQVLEDSTQDVDWVSGACMLVKRETWMEVGGLSERWFMYAEDIDFCFRAKSLGWRVIYDSNCFARHLVASSSKASNLPKAIWLVNLFDFYKLRFAPKPLTSFVWKAVTSGGFIVRGLLSLLSGRTRRVRANTFLTYAASLWKSSPVPKKVKFYPVSRTVHVERVLGSPDQFLYYTKTRSDWDYRLATESKRVEKCGTLAMGLKILRAKTLALEVPEPLAVALLPQIMFLSLVAKFKNVISRGEPVFLSSYAIENFDGAEKIHNRLPIRMPNVLVKLAVTICVRIAMLSIKRVAFGTQAAFDNYAQIIGIQKARAKLREGTFRIFSPLPKSVPITDFDWGQKDPDRVGFLGELNDKKGFDDLISSWHLVSSSNPKAHLEVITFHNPNLDLLKKLRAEQNVSLLVGLSREEIFKQVAAWHVLVLPSRRTRYWREQIGLPILEGLSLGCEIVTTKETAIWQWLEDHGHRVLPFHFSKTDLSNLILESLADTRNPEVITSHLPKTDGRADADRWLNSVGIK